jgi:hypothetical protein
VRSNLNPLLGHDQRAVKESEIADPTLAVFADGERAAGITGNMLADNYGTRFFAAKFPENLRALTIKSFAELNVVRDGLRPPIAFDASIFSNVAHNFGTAATRRRFESADMSAHSKLQMISPRLSRKFS